MQPDRVARPVVAVIDLPAEAFEQPGARPASATTPAIASADGPPGPRRRVEPASRSPGKADAPADPEARRAGEGDREQLGRAVDDQPAAELEAQALGER